MIDQVDLALSLDEEQYWASLKYYQGALRFLCQEVFRRDQLVIIVFEGWDAAGKGGAIKRLTASLDPRDYLVFPIGAPKGEDATHHYLWRFWRRLPERGQIAIFDRSWYGRVLVERVEGFCQEQEWKRAYREINQFENQLLEFGAIIIKFWIHISPEEQLRRFEERGQDKFKQWKLTQDDWRNRSKWDQYYLAVEDMLIKTSTPAAPWIVVEGNDKFYARIKILSCVVETLMHEFNIKSLDHLDDFFEIRKKTRK
jgi:polyphosphate kinase 2 (PPK2 family)